MKKMKNKYNHYTEGFRREAVRRSDEPNTSAAEVANKKQKSETEKPPTRSVRNWQR